MAWLTAIVGALCLAVCQWLIYVYAPTEATMGIIQKIFYMHLPLSWWGLISFFTVFIASIGYLIKRDSRWDHLSQSCLETGVLFCGLALVTGMIWGKNSWGVWWTWDPRLTTTLVMWFIYAACLMLRHMDMPLERQRTISAVIGIIAFIDVPLVFFSARIFRSIHPAVFASRGGGMEPAMLYTLLACILSLGIFWLGIILTRKEQLAINDSLRKTRFIIINDSNI